MNLCFWRKSKSIASLASSEPIPLELLKKYTRIAVIDDEYSSLPIDNLKSDGFAIDYFQEIDQILLKRLLDGEFDIIVLDIKGVVSPVIIKNDGLGVLQYLKEKNPTQIIVACSSKRFDPSQHKFFSIANDVLVKPITYIDCKEKLERIIQNNITILGRWNDLTKYLQHIGWKTRDIERLEKQVVCTLQSHTSFPEKALSHLDKHSASYSLILNLIQLICKIGS